MCIIVQIFANNRYVLVCLEICYQPTLIACTWCEVQYGRFLPRDAMLSAVHAVVVYLSVRVGVSVTLRYCVKTAERRITQIMPHDSDIL